MTNPMTFNGTVASKMREELNEAVQSVAKKYGVRIHFGNCSYSEIEMNYKVNVKTNDLEAIAEKDKKTWNSYCTMYGFKPEHFAKTFLSRGTMYRIAGLDLKKHRFALKAVRVADETMFGFDPEQISLKFKMEEK